MGEPEATVAAMDCLFCSIVAGDVPSRKVYEDAAAYAFLDINPFGTGHTLVIPKRHAVSALEDDGTFAEIAPAVTTVARTLVDALGADGVNILSSAGAVAGQEVFHLHVHVVPRYESSPGLRNLFVHSHDDLDAVLARITGAR